MLQKEVWSFEGHPEISISVELAESWWARFKGLMLRSPLSPGQGLFLKSTNSIHMCFMRFAIDAVYFDSSMTIVKIVRRLHPWIRLPQGIVGAGDEGWGSGPAGSCNRHEKNINYVL